ncbi:MAG: hypothetical protein KZQ83_03450 [gamma proteobacterium symbiont of Taylorina sp.]|nr:hypothetical protein [gamma proteobacterium symbiont of Taylorina sp.]
MDLLKIILAIFMLSFVTLFFGVSGIIEHKSPADIASLTLLGSSFMSYFEYHALIIIGALSLTLSIWFLERELH